MPPTAAMAVQAIIGPTQPVAVPAQGARATEPGQSQSRRSQGGLRGGMRLQAMRVAVATHALGRDLPVRPEAPLPTDHAGHLDPKAFGGQTLRGPDSIAATTRSRRSTARAEGMTLSSCKLIQ